MRLLKIRKNLTQINLTQITRITQIDTDFLRGISSYSAQNVICVHLRNLRNLHQKNVNRLLPLVRGASQPLHAAPASSNPRATAPAQSQ